ncbi:MAG: sulfatase [Anaerolineae bacterium]|nr:sulfatase [Anaerolineae bacterium]
MRILYIDVDTLRPDHLGCYGYHRDTSPNIDALARQSVRFDSCYVTDAPCLPSRTALWSGRAGFHTGVINHGGTAADPFIEGPARGFRDTFYATNWMTALRRAGFRTVTVSPFAERHSAWHWCAGYTEIYNTGKSGMERADEVVPTALDWLRRNGQSDNWFLHVNTWDPHTPYRTPEDFGNPFAGDPLPAWITEAVWRRAWETGFGPHSAREPHGYGDETFYEQYPRVPAQLDSMEAVKMWIDGYDVGIRYTDRYIGQLLNLLDELGVLDETVIVFSSDHGENQGELGVWGDHQTADHITCRVPLLVRWPGITDGAPRADGALYYHYDWAATLVELAGGQVPANWDARPFTEAFRAGAAAGREYLVVSQGAWSCQRSVRFDDYICLRTYHDGYKALDPVMLFNLADDPHEQRDLAGEAPAVVDRAMGYLAEWYHAMMLASEHNIDPMMTVLREGGPFHTRGMLPAYLERLRATGRGAAAERLAARHPDEL